MRKFEYGDLVRHKETGKLLVVMGGLNSNEFIIVMDKTTLEACRIKEELLEYIGPTEPDSMRLEWLFENGMSKLDKRVVFGDDVSLDNFRNRIDALMADED